MKKYCHIEYSGKSYFSLVRGNYCYILNKSYLENAKITDKKIHIKKVKFLAPVNPTKIIGIGKNFKDGSRSDLKFPEIFLKPNNSLTISKNIKFPKLFNSLLIEGELGLIIGKKGKNISIKKANEYIFGFISVVDFSGRDEKFNYPITALLKKGCDDMLPISKFVYKTKNFKNFEIKTKLGKKIIQKDTLNNLIFPIDKCISSISKFITLNVGDIILMGTPNPKVKISNTSIINVSIGKDIKLNLNFKIIK